MQVEHLQGAEWIAERLFGDKSKTWQVYDYARRGIIPCVRIGRSVRFSPAALEEFIRAGGRPLPSDSANAS